MIEINENTVIATGKEISESGLFPHFQPTDTQVILWIKWTWGGRNEGMSFAPIAELLLTEENNTHKISDKTLFFKLPKNRDGSYMFEEFISRYITIERI
jgi:hypothetical protein